MPSMSWQQWTSTRARQLDDIEAAHRSVGGTGRGRRFATEQINHAYAVLLASQFQGFCRDLHTECVDQLVLAAAPITLRSPLRVEFLLNRTLDRGHANPGSIGSDFNRLGLRFWERVYLAHPDNERRRQRLDELNRWRNAIVHQDFDASALGGDTTLRLPQVRAWRRSCNRLARSFDNVMQAYLAATTGMSPW